MAIRWQDSVRTRIIAWAFIPTLLILGAVGAFTLYTYQRVTEALVMERNQALTRLVASQLAAEMVSYADLLDRLAMTRDVTGFVPPAQATALRWSIGELRVFDGGVVILDSTGRVTAADPRRPELVGQDWSGRSYFQRLLPGSTNALGSDIEADGPGGASVVAVALPIRGEQGRFLGVIAGMLLLDQRQPSSLYRSLGKLQVRPQSHMVLVDSHGRAIDLRSPGRTGQDLSMQLAVRALLSGQTGALRTRGTDGREIIASYAPVPDTSWGLVEEEDWGALVEVSAGYGRALLLLLALGLAVPPLLVAAGIRRITRPLAELTAGAGAMAQGKLGQAIAVPGNDELAALAAALNHTAAELQDLYAGLERKVADRTQELATLNAVAAAVSRSLDLEHVLGAALAEVCAALEVPAAAAYRIEEGERSLALVAQRGLSTAGRAARLPLAAAAPLVEAGEPTLWAPAGLPAGELGDLARAEGWPAIAGLPLVARGRFLGAIILGGAAPAKAGRDALLAAIGRQVSMAADNARLYEQAEQAAATAERQRLARELHDSVTQTLFAANLIAGVLPALWEADPAAGRARLAELGRLTQGALAEMRMLLVELRPQALAQTPLPDLLRHLAGATTGRAGVPVAAVLAGEIELPADVRVALFRIAQEALNNVARHAHATRASITLQRRAATPARVELVVRDDGCGFEPAAAPAGHLGLRIMRERAEAAGASLSVVSAPGAGTEIRVTWSEQPPAIEG